MSIDTLRAIVDEWDLRAKRNADTIAALQKRILELEAGVPPVDPPVDPPPPPPPPPPPGEPGTLPETVDVGHGDVIPVPGRINVQTKNGGDWSNPATWSTNAVPRPTDRVRILPQHVVVLDTDAVCDVLVVEGTLHVDTSAATSLTCATLFGMPTGKFWCGEDEAEATDSFTLTFRPAAADAADPKRYLGGLVWLGTCTIHGRAKSAGAEIRLIEAGENFFVPMTMPTGWEKGDEIIVPDTRQLKSAERAAGYNQIERVKITDIPDDMEIGVSGGFTFDHRPATNDDGVADVMPRVANVTRNIVFKADVPGTAHVMFAGHAKVDIRYAAFLGMGRTTNAPLDATNLIGRYPLHMHHVHHPFHVEGVVVDQGDEAHDLKWGLTGHGSVGTFKDCITFNTQGAGIMLEDGSEVITIEGCCVIKVGGIGGRLDSDKGGRGRQGTGIYCSGPFVRLIDNFVANVHTAHPHAYAYGLSFFRLGRVRPVGSSDLVDGNGGGHLVFRGNVAFACQSFLTFWWVGHGSPRPLSPLETLFEDCVSVNLYELDVFQYQCAHVHFRGWKTRGERKEETAWNGMDYPAPNLVIEGADIQGRKLGFALSNDGGPQTVKDSFIGATTGILTGTPWTSTAWADEIPPREVVVTNCKFPPGTTAIARVFATKSELASRSLNLVIEDTLTVRDFQGKAGDNFRVFMEEQRAEFVVPATVPFKDGKSKVIGSPEPGLTNAACWAKHKVAIAGAVAPAGVKAREGIGGLVL